jgi:hypothetical protein
VPARTAAARGRPGAGPRPPTFSSAPRSANKDAMPYVFMFAAMLMLTMLVACVVSV